MSLILIDRFNSYSDKQVLCGIEKLRFEFDHSPYSINPLRTRAFASMMKFVEGSRLKDAVLACQHKKVAAESSCTPLLVGLKRKRPTAKAAPKVSNAAEGNVDQEPNRPKRTRGMVANTSSTRRLSKTLHC